MVLWVVEANSFPNLLESDEGSSHRSHSLDNMNIVAKRFVLGRRGIERILIAGFLWRRRYGGGNRPGIKNISPVGGIQDDIQTHESDD